jgi:hypothetical protein
MAARMLEVWAVLVIVGMSAASVWCVALILQVA